MKWIIYSIELKSSEAMILAVMNAIDKYHRLLYAIDKYQLRWAAGIIASLDFTSAVQYMIHFIYHFHRWFIHHKNIRTHKWPVSNVSDFIMIAQLHRYHEVQTLLKSWTFQASLRNC